MATKVDSEGTVPPLREKRDMSTLTPAPTPPPPTPSPAALYEDNQTLALIRRVLRPQSSPNSPLEEILPALTSSPAVDIQLYAFIAIICRDFIFAWYSKITNDRTFVDEVIKVIAHTTRSLEQRLRQIDLEVLLLDELPALLNNHVRDFRQCVYRHKTSLCPHLSVPEIFHNLQPHPALKSSLESERIYLKLLSSGILAALLPTEDLQSHCERTLVREILSSLVLWNVVDKLSEPWMLYEIITKVLRNAEPGVLQPTDGASTLSLQNEVFHSGEDDVSISKKDVVKRKRRKSRREERRSSKHRLQKYPSSDSPPRNSAPSPAPLPPLYTGSSSTTPTSPFSQHVESFITFSVVAITLALTAITSIYNFINYPPPAPRRKKPILRMSFLNFMSNFLKLDSRQPWLRGNILLALSPLAAQPAGSFVDMILSDLFHTHVTSHALLVQILASARAAMFPSGGSMGPPRPHPTESEKLAMREAAARALVRRIPGWVKRHWFGGGAEGEEERECWKVVEEHLDVLADKEINKHLVYQVVELLVVRLVPEVGEAVVRELLEGRIGGGGASQEGE
ncbi:PXA domain-containing protein [Kalaharituber pfeilii]|nr:PXA domain-containing protein [Kalaharituber pfeilii]